MALPSPGYLAYGRNPDDSTEKPNRPAIVLFVDDEGEDPDLLVIFGQSFRSGEGRYVHIERSEHRRIRFHGYFYENNVHTLPTSHFNSFVPQRLPSDLWKSLIELVS